MPKKVASVSSHIPAQAQKVFSGKFFEIYQWPQELYDGSIATFERGKRPNTAGVLAITKDKKILVTEQEQPLHAPFWGLLGGVVDPGETPEEAAHRELLEESGYKAGRMDEWFSMQLSTRIEWMIHIFIARDIKKVQQAALDPGEKIKVHALSFEAFLELVQRDDFRDQEVSLQVLKAMVDPQKMTALKKLLFE